ncbi:MAG TPA: alpha-amylase family glycosyl hydrolase [Anaerolineales bacterium]|jgi:sucrose phosphorylase|nr:alpha-amylase family glycosyl hydrolase [Anaerolineales bacterium]
MVQPDFSTVQSHLTALYGSSVGDKTFERLRSILDRYSKLSIFSRASQSLLSEQDSVLITYADQLSESDTPPLETLARFCEKHLSDLVSSIHVLPFYPYSSDDGFSVINYRAVNPEFGSWDDISQLSRNFRLMFDAVINHASVQHEWFQGFLKDDPRYRDYFVVVEGDPDLSQVVRPRALPLLTTFDTPSGPKQVWTTFSADQVDLNFQNPDVLLEIIDTLLFYVSHGAELIRLDAIAYLWKEVGTTCIHLPQTHRIIQLFRAVLDAVAPHVILITETNVPHIDNISYFGNGRDEAQMVYNFALPPLVLHALHTGNSRVLSKWASDLTLPSNQTTFFNFLASHDGIGVNPARGILPDDEIDALIQRVIDHGGLISYKNDGSGRQIPYEMNINYFDALSNPDSEEPLSVQVDRFMISQAIMLALVGVPGIYFHSLFGSRGWDAGVERTGRNRTINRQKFDLVSFERELQEESSQRQQVFQRYARLLRARAGSSAFHPHGSQEILDYGNAVFAALRFSPDRSTRVLCLHNISDQSQRLSMESKEIFGLFAGGLIDLISEQRMDDLLNSVVTLQPYQSLWLRIKE